MAKEKRGNVPLARVTLSPCKQALELTFWSLLGYHATLNVLKRMVPVSKLTKSKLLAHKKSLIALAEKSTPLNKKKKILVQRKLFKCPVTTGAACVELDSHLKINKKFKNLQPRSFVKLFCTYKNITLHLATTFCE